MKIYILLLGLLLCVGLQGQVIHDDPFVLKTDVYGKTLAEVLDAIEQQTAYSFIYDARVIDLSAPVRERLQGRSLLDLLDLLFKDTDIAFTVVNKQIILNHREYVIRMQENQIVISAQDIDFSTSAEETQVCQYAGAAMSIGFKSTFLIDILNNISADEVVIELADPSRAGVIIPVEQEENEDLLMLLMPMMLND